MNSNFNPGREEDDVFNLSGQNPKFFKIIIEDTIRQGRLRIPNKFVKNHGDCLSRRIILKVPDSTKWKMEVGIDSNEAWLQKGWKEFSEYYSLKHGYLLVFKYQYKSNFLVFIFDTSLLEIPYPTKPDSSPNQLNELMEIEDSETQNPNQFQAKSNKPKGIRISRALEAADKFRPRKPWFKVVLKSNLSLNIPIGFIRDHTQGSSHTVVLKVEGVRRCWTTKLNVHWQGSYAKLSAGWCAFVKDNCLRSRDVCVFELVARNTLKVHIFRHLPLNA